MDSRETGRLIYRLRTERHMTQRVLAEALNVSDKTVSKWECGLGCPDITLLAGLSEVFSVDVRRLLDGSLDEHDADGGNMKNTSFYVCPVCGSFMIGCGAGSVSCCGRILQPLEPQQLLPGTDNVHAPKVELCDDEWYVTFNHPMSKDHYVSFCAYLSFDRMMLVRLYPEQEASLSIPRMRPGTLLVYCSHDGLFSVPIK